MPYYRAPAERPRQPKRFLTSREVEDMAAAGQTEIVHADDLVITDAARETAQDLGVRISKAAQQPQPAQPARAAPAISAAPHPAAQRPPAAALGVTVAALAARGADPLVKALVDAVRANPTLAGVARKG